MSRVSAALDAGIDPDTFERCATQLMADIYDKVAPIEGGSDGGRDADIYGPIAGEPESRGRILVTTGDMLDNLKSSHATWQKIWAAGEPFRVDQLVMVTHLSLSDAKRRNILKYCVKHDLPTPQIWTRGWLISALRKDPEWRTVLTGVTGRMEAVSPRPSVAGDAPPLVGRVDELDLMQKALEHTGDITVVGLPGVGKSRLTAELTGNIHIIEPRAREYLTDDLLAADPAVVIVDDAHLHLDIIEEVVRARSAQQLSFRIIAVMWPGGETRVETMLTDPDRIMLDRLDRPDLDQVIRGLGVHGIRARATVLDQADGRPGWAVMLGRLIVDGEDQTVISGQRLLDTVSSLTLEIAGTARLNEALACVAALGHASLEDLETISAFTGTAQADLVSWLEATAQGGVIARTGDSWAVFPALRTLLVAAWFFGARRTRTWSALTTSFGDDPRLNVTLLEVVDLVPGPEAHDLADQWYARRASDINDQVVSRRGSDGLLGAAAYIADLLDPIQAYATLSVKAADRASLLARQLLATPREPETTVFGRTHDPVGAAGAAILRAAFAHTCSREALHGLLDLAVDDNRARHSNADHPVRVIQDLAHYLDPEWGPIGGLRNQILTNLFDWFDEAPGPQRWTLTAEVAGHVFDPHVEGSWLDPGSHRSFTMARGIDTAPVLVSLVERWREIDARVHDGRGDGLTHAAVAHLCQVFDVWSNLSVAGGEGGFVITDEHRTAARTGAQHALLTLTNLADRFPGIPIRIHRRLELLRLSGDDRFEFEAPPVRDDRLARFVGVREYGDDVDDHLAQRRAEQESLAAELADWDPSAAVAEFHRLVVDAALLEGHHGGDWFAMMLAEHVTDPCAWLRVAVDDGARPLAGPLLAKAREHGGRVDSLVDKMLNRDDLRHVALRTFATSSGEVDATAAVVLASMREGDAVLIGDLWVSETDTPMLAALLGHPLGEIRALAAVSYAEGLAHGAVLPDGARAAWKAALLGAQPDKLPSHSRWRLEQVMKDAVESDPELFADWFIANADTSRPRYGFRRKTGGFGTHLRALPAAQKLRICTQLSPAQLIESGWLSDLLGHDETLADHLLTNGTIDTGVLLRAMSGYRDHTVECLAPVLLSAGIEAEEIADRSLRRRDTSGSVAASIRSDLAFYAELAERRPELRPVAAAATTTLESELDHANTEERMDRLHGW